MRNFLLALAFAAGGCSMTIGAVNPRPNVAVGASVKTVAVDTSQVVDMQQPRGENPNGTLYLAGVTVTDFRTTLDTGFQNAVGNHYAKTEAPIRLVFDEAELGLSNLGSLGRFLTIRYRAHWTDGNGQTIAEVAGMAQPRNPTETGRRHLEDVVEVMYEKLIDGLDKVTTSKATAKAAGSL